MRAWDNTYAYDPGGNMIVDRNKGVTSIEYNHLNLVRLVRKSPTDYIVHTYDASGRKLAQQVFGSNAQTTDSIGEYPLLSKDNDSEKGPKAYLNYLVFDRDYNLIAKKTTPSDSMIL